MILSLYCLILSDALMLIEYNKLISVEFLMVWEQRNVCKVFEFKLICGGVDYQVSDMLKRER